MNKYEVLIAYEVDGEMVEAIGTAEMSSYPDLGDVVTVTLIDAAGATIQQTGTVIFIM